MTIDPQILREAREAADLRICDVARALGISDSNVIRWENGKNEPQIRALCRLSLLYGVALPDLVSWDSVRAEWAEDPKAAISFGDDVADDDGVSS